MRLLKYFIAVLLVMLLARPAFAQDAETDTSFEMILYVSTGCPHCEKVEQFIEKNSLQDEITIKDTIADPGVSEEYTEILDGMGVPVDERGVPLLLYAENEYVTGDTPIISYLSERFGIVEEKVEENAPSYSSEDYIILFGGGGIVLAIVGYGAYNSIRDRKK